VVAAVAVDVLRQAARPAVAAVAVPKAAAAVVVAQAAAKARA
jgi:hypothetical protein